MMHDHQVLIPAAFVNRPNRFVTKAVMGDAVVTCHMPNPGRMWELLYEGDAALPSKSQGSSA